MNKLALIVITSLTLCVLCGCSDSFTAFVSCNPGDSTHSVATVSDSPSDTDSDSTAENPVGISMTAHDVTPTSLLLRVEQKGCAPTGELSMGAAYTLERSEGGGWVAVEPLYGEPIFNLLAQLIAPTSTTEAPRSLSIFPPCTASFPTAPIVSAKK